MTNERAFSLPVKGLPRALALLCALIAASGVTESDQCLAQQADAAAIASPVWSPTGKLNVARYVGHTATLLANGKVLVTGGGPNYVDDHIAVAELYDPDTGIWTLTGPMKVPRNSHTATLLSNGQVLVAGGDTGKSTTDDTAELYDPVTGTWSLTGKMNGARSGHTATLLQNGKVLIAGGWGGEAGLRTAELYDPSTRTWRVTGQLIKGRYWHAMTSLADGTALIVGGSNDGDLESVLGTAELFDPVHETWRSAGSLKFGAVGTTATLLANGTVLVAAGYGSLSPGSLPWSPHVSINLAQVYDPVIGAWSDPVSLGIGRGFHTATLLPDGDVLLAGGVNWYVNPPLLHDVLDRTELYSDATGESAEAPALGVARSRHTATLLRNGKVLVVGGGTDVVELYGSAVAGSITAGMTGSWYNPAQGGQGFMLEVLQGNPVRLLASWFVFAPEGGPSWIVGLGPVNGNRAVVQGMQAAGPGGRFPPNFVAANVHNTSWGTLTFTFSDCNHGHVQWSSTVPGYSSGEMDLMRLTLPAGLSCVD